MVLTCFRAGLLIAAVLHIVAQLDPTALQHVIFMRQRQVVAVPGPTYHSDSIQTPSG